MYELAAGSGRFEAYVVALLTVALGGAVGWWLRKLIAPPGKASTPGELGRSCAGWVVFVVCLSTLSQFFGKLDEASFLLWLIGGGFWSLVAFALGWAYGALFKFRSTASLASIPTPAATERPVIDEDAIYAVIAQELEAGVVDKALWTRLFAEAAGEENKVKALYIKQRFDRLAAQEQAATIAK